ncbi:photosystem I subunit PsaN [Marchantia polymorpha subsp. ruderalis]|uniref:Photosystem I reaction center subunit N, chloroplastic n=2 Tax=Marchantia polymorpha TaxID=3197 RepID=A0A176W4N1_MARPO|nr:hypothetical protein AXG93_2779s1190 [Marchantia polymorpha subsp. ruderalis]PTQ31056.1 hypothetical protein MARPO_0116s0042 [Marchantia polymorpha]BBN09521.1 hypothetical protein Mp_4g20410 [Marchantia polymorpha subsp. ruderalis]|eukprot:PTQ31056.1 hypothetical protein MARPO_0116s0042 [Marchantia polymorpha]
MATAMLGSTAIATPAALAVRDLKVAVNGQSSVSCVAKKSFVVSASSNVEETSSRRDIMKMAAAMFAVGAFSGVGSAKASLTSDLLAKSTANKELNDAKRLATSGANLARSRTVADGTCLFPNNFTGCEDLAKKQEVKFLTEDKQLECQGKEAYKCASNSHYTGPK